MKVPIHYDDMRERLAKCLMVLTIGAVSMAVFIRCVAYGLVNFDDYQYILSHVEIVKFSGLKTLIWCFSSVSDAIWMPLTWLSYMLDHTLFGSWYGGYHLHSLIIHAINAALVYRLLVILLESKKINQQASSANKHLTTFCCLVATLVWSIHPLRCESVVLLSSRKDLLSFFWEVLAVIFWVYGSRSELLKRRIVLTSTSIVFFLIGAMCKPSVMTFPLLCLLLDIFVIRCVRPLRFVVPMLLMVVLMAFSSWQQIHGGAMGNLSGEPLFAKLAGASAAFGIYLRNTVLPFWLAIQCIKRWPAPPHFLLPGLIISVLWCGYLLKRCLTYWKNQRETVSIVRYENCPVLISFGFSADYILAGMAWFALAIGPMLGIVSFGYHAHADRFTYIPSVGLSLMLAFGLNAAVQKFGLLRPLVLIVCVVFALVVLTWRQTGIWQNDEALFSHTLEVDGDDNDTAHTCLAMYYFEVPHDLAKARHHFEKAKRARETAILDAPEFYVLTLSELGQDDEAAAVLREYHEVLVKCFGEETAYKIICGAADLDAIGRSLRRSYLFARVASLLGRRPSTKDAISQLEALRDENEENAIWQYLLWRSLALSGEKFAAEKLLTRIRDSSTKTTYAQFRFLQEAK